MYFTSPQEAIPIITRLLEERDFKTLAKFYALAGTGVQRSDLESGDFFIRNKRPEMAHPGGFWRYKHPFAPGFKYSARHTGPRPGVFVIEVTLTIDQGAGPAQVGKSFFCMITTDQGWQLLPDRAKQVPAPLPAVVD